MLRAYRRCLTGNAGHAQPYASGAPACERNFLRSCRAYHSEGPAYTALYNAPFSKFPLTMIIYALTIFTSAFLLFLVQPIMAKQILPWFGGSAAVWTTCLVFFQFLLLFGYAYSDWTTRHMKPRHQVALHIVLLALRASSRCRSSPMPAWKPAGDEEPTWRILGLLGATIGLPYFLLSTTGPLVQAWFARTFPAGHRLSALRAVELRLAARAGLLSVRARAVGQRRSRSRMDGASGYAVFVALCIAAALYSVRSQPAFAAGRSDRDRR